MLWMPKKGGESVLSEQEALADRTKDFLNRWGLKAKYVAEVCNIHEKVFSKFTNHHVTLSKSQLQRLTGYMAEYEERMKPIAPKINTDKL